MVFAVQRVQFHLKVWRATLFLAERTVFELSLFLLYEEWMNETNIIFIAIVIVFYMKSGSENYNQESSVCMVAAIVISNIPKIRL